MKTLQLWLVRGQDGKRGTDKGADWLFALPPRRECGPPPCWHLSHPRVCAAGTGRGSLQPTSPVRSGRGQLGENTWLAHRRQPLA